MNIPYIYTILFYKYKTVIMNIYILYTYEILKIK